jgi:HTH-type transcriptional regulator, sugar sensing transcriptional regulator
MDNNQNSPANEALERKLHALGLTGNEAKIYLNMLGRPMFKASEVALVAGVPRPKVYEALTNLVNKGFCFEVAGTVAQFKAVSPNEALPAYQNMLEHEMEQTMFRRRHEVTHLVEELTPLHEAGQTETGTLRYIDILYERKRITQVANNLLAEAKETILIFEKEPYAQDPRTLNAYEIDALKRGVKVRAIFEEGVKELEPRRKVLAAAGAEVKIAPSLPMKLIVCDEQAAICAMRDPITGQQSLTSMRIAHPDFAKAMRLLFDSIWQSLT